LYRPFTFSATQHVYNRYSFPGWRAARTSQVIPASELCHDLSKVQHALGRELTELARQMELET
jgi:hypothetical protein